jgi:hypothetical protein
MQVFLPSEYEWVFSFNFEVAVTTFIGTSTMDCIDQINADGGRQIYNPLNNCISDRNSSRFGCIHVLCTSTSGSTSPKSSSRAFPFLRLGLDVTGGRDKADFEVLSKTKTARNGDASLLTNRVTFCFG